jgi:hypothetical protein
MHRPPPPPAPRPGIPTGTTALMLAPGREHVHRAVTLEGTLPGPDPHARRTEGRMRGPASSAARPHPCTCANSCRESGRPPWPSRIHRLFVRMDILTPLARVGPAFGHAVERSTSSRRNRNRSCHLVRRAQIISGSSIPRQGPAARRLYRPHEVAVPLHGEGGWPMARRTAFLESSLSSMVSERCRPCRRQRRRGRYGRRFLLVTGPCRGIASRPPPPACGSLGGRG